MSAHADSSWTPAGMLAELDAMPHEERLERAGQLLELLAQAEQWQARGATLARWDELSQQHADMREELTQLRSERLRIEQELA